jgi:hypothetical protein
VVPIVVPIVVPAVVPIVVPAVVPAVDLPVDPLLIYTIVLEIDSDLLDIRHKTIFA